MSVRGWLIGLAAVSAAAGFAWWRSDGGPARTAAAPRPALSSAKSSAAETSPIPDCLDAVGALPFGRPCIPATFKNVPPDPGPAGNATPAGIDANGNGVRDDVERYIAAVYPDPPQLRASLMQYAKAVAPMSSDRLKTADEALSISRQSLRALECQSRLIVPEPRAFTAAELDLSRRWGKAVDDTRLRFLNTPERLRIYIENERLLAGRVVDMPNEIDPRKLCDFDPRSP